QHLLVVSINGGGRLDKKRCGVVFYVMHQQHQWQRNLKWLGFGRCSARRLVGAPVA
ncbi:hypothetical protein PanWU01x14_035910, partial [Parasponia andersonii]